MIPGAIGDDFTGSSDLGLTLAAGGLRTVQYVGVPGAPAGPQVDAGITALKIGPMIDPGVPGLRVTGQRLALALKSGNFGAPDFFTRAAERPGA